MASIKLTGDTSGEITISAPAVAGTNTLTLPANTGNIVTTGDSGTVTQGMVASGVAGTGPLFRVGSNATQAISANTWTKVTFGAEFTDTNNNFASSRFTPTVAGYYFLTARVGEGLTGAPDQVLYAAIYKNGGTELKNQTVAPASWYDNIDISGIVYMNGSTDYVELYFYTSASGYTKSASPVLNYFQGYLVRAA